jgi:hypothetical protein
MPSLIVRPPTTKSRVYRASMTVKQSATRAGFVLQKEADVSPAEADRFVWVLSQAPIGTEILHRSGYRFTIRRK